MSIFVSFFHFILYYKSSFFFALAVFLSTVFHNLLESLLALSLIKFLNRLVWEQRSKQGREQGKGKVL